MNINTRNSSSDEDVMIELLDIENLDSILSKIVIPFSEVIQTNPNTDIYNGYEKIPFNKRDPLFKTLLLREFKDALHNYNMTAHDEGS